MKKRFAIFSSIALAMLAVYGQWVSGAGGQGTDSASTRPATSSGNASGDVLLDSATTRLRSHRTLSTRVRVQINMYGHKLFGSGRYAQAGNGRGVKTRFDLSIPGTDQTFSVRHVNDGRQWWRYEKRGEEESLTVVDLTTAREAVAQGGSLNHISTDLGNTLSGLPQLLDGIQRNFQFGEAASTTWNQQNIWVMRGRWKRDRVAKLLGAKGQFKELTSSKMHQRLPGEVVVFLDTETLIPLRVEFAHLERGSAATPQTKQPMFIMEFLDLKLGVPLEDDLFERPSDLPAADVTDRFVKSRGTEGVRP